MLAWIIAASVFLPGQTSDAFFGAIPENVPTFQIIERGERKGYGALQLDGQWVKDVAEITTAKRPLIVYDTPWAPSSETARYGRFEYQPSAEALRKERLRSGWRRAGYVFVDTSNGDIPVLSEDLALAERARDMTRQQHAPAAAANLATAPTEGSATAQPSFFRLWGGHIVAVIVGLALLGAVVKFMLFNDEDTWEKVG